MKIAQVFAVNLAWIIFMLNQKTAT